MGSMMNGTTYANKDEQLIKKLLMSWRGCGLGDAIVAGGAPLSIKTGKDVNDIDMYVTSLDIKDSSRLSKFIEFLKVVGSKKYQLKEVL